jgi:peptidoglycan/LPS O-acetylase OafA/YrhL
LGIISCAIAVSSITYLLIEKPGVELGKKLLHRPKPATELGQPSMIQTPSGPVRAVTAA